MATQKIEPFEPTQETFARYIQRIQIHFQAADVPDAKQKLVFLHSLSRKHYTLLANLVSPQTPDENSQDELIKALSNHFQPKSSVISERYTFHSRSQEAGESLTDFVASLSRLIVTCDYATAFQHVLLRDRFVCGLANESTRKRLLTEDDKLTLERALEIALRVEKATIHAKQMRSDPRLSGGILYTSQGRTESQFRTAPRPTPSCHRCGGPHLAPNCRFIHEKCRSCGKTGHIAKSAEVNLRTRKRNRRIQILVSRIQRPISEPTLSIMPINFLQYIQVRLKPTTCSTCLPVHRP